MKSHLELEELNSISFEAHWELSINECVYSFRRYFVMYVSKKKPPFNIRLIGARIKIIRRF